MIIIKAICIGFIAELAAMLVFVAAFLGDSAELGSIFEFLHIPSHWMLSEFKGIGFISLIWLIFFFQTLVFSIIAIPFVSVLSRLQK
jgi:hypothetical protein